jgi:hypothetical protein
MKRVKFSLFLFSQSITVICYANSNCIVGDSVKNYTSFISLNGHLAINSNAIGVKYVGDFTFKNNNKIGLGFNLASEKIWFTDNIIIPQNINTTILFGTGGLNIRYQLNNYLFFQPEFSVLFGKQSITELISKPTSYNTLGYPTSYKYSENKTEQSIFGAHLEQHIFYYPKKAKNLVIGLSIFERIINAKYYDEDFGINGYIGLSF